MNPTYVATARLLTEIAPVVFENGLFALKGGTAINLFLRDMPRLSVDLDLVFTDHRIPRADALAAINTALRAANDRLTKLGFKVQTVSAADMGETKLLVQRENLSVKIEVNTVIRGTVHQTRTMALTAAASDALMADLEIPLLAPEEIYGGKLVAAMDRQHPRDLFDVMELFAHGGITPGISRCFVVHLASHNRTLHEVLFPTAKDIQLAYEGSFVGMTTEPVTLEALLETRERLFHELPASLDANGHSCGRWCGPDRTGRCSISLISRSSPPSDGDSSTSSSCRGATRIGFARSPQCWMSVWDRNRARRTVSISSDNPTTTTRSLS